MEADRISEDASREPLRSATVLVTRRIYHNVTWLQQIVSLNVDVKNLLIQSSTMTRVGTMMHAEAGFHNHLSLVSSNITLHQRSTPQITSNALIPTASM